MQSCDAFSKEIMEVLSLKFFANRIRRIGEYIVGIKSAKDSWEK